jgi:hypothetical protein
VCPLKLDPHQHAEHSRSDPVHVPAGGHEGQPELEERPPSAQPFTVPKTER